ncbi:hypothetical protein CFAM422_003533 [Trichoderma lentiforme]|uniref:NACHT domain-containing protein n=1 Tax=Trichoderma lentiforme TaxID=1567552 RepID=A0A9P4XKH2_9HYPO|nr:hypothetical protein CFAM422_003533 [Trichoderma lentiforme]
MDPMDSSSRNVANNKFGDKITINQNNIQNPAADQTDQCLKDLRLTDPRDDKTRIQQTKGGLLKESSNWIFENETFKQWRDDEHNTLLWIKGDPGKGKTMLLSAIIDELTPSTKLAKPMGGKTNTLLSYFFCQGTDSRINNATAVLRGLIYLIIIQERLLVSHVQERYNQAGKDLFIDANAWVALSGMLLNILRDPKVGGLVFVVDALDECETDSAKLLDFITKYASLPRVKWIISSRNNLNIQQKLEPFIRSGILSLELKANAETVSNAVDIYIEHRISRLRSVQHNQDQRDELRDALREKAHGTFLWVSLVMKELEDVQSWEVTEVVKEMPMDLSAVYRRMISQIRNQRRGNVKLCWKILSAIFTAYYPLSLGELGILAGLPNEISEHFESIKKLVTMCGSFLTIREDTIYFIHQSAKDFLSTEVFQSDAAQRHADIFEQSITAISTLPQNIYGLPDFGFRSEHTWAPEPNPLAPIRYSCFCWIGHFCDAYGANPKPETGLLLQEKLWSFLKDNVLRWLESMILLGGLANALRSLQKMAREFDADSQLSEFLHSTERFIINNGPLITRTPLQVYGSALVFSQASSAMNQHQWKERLPLIEHIKGVIQTNNALLQTLEGHTSTVMAVCFSMDGKAIASSCRNGNVRIWDAATGAIQHTYRAAAGYRDILAISFAPDSESVVFLSHKYRLFVEDSLSLVTLSLDTKTPSLQLDNTSSIRLNEAIGRENSPWLKHSARATFSLDGQMLAITRASDGPIELWNVATRLRLRKFLGDRTGGPIHGLAFSPDSKTIASGDEDATVSLWDVETGACFRKLATYTHRHSPITAIAFRLDSKKLVFRSWAPSENTSIRVLDIATGRSQETHMSHDNGIWAIAFSPDGRTIAVGSEYGVIRLWDADLGMQPWMSGDTARPKAGPTRSKIIEKMVFSPDGKILALSTIFLSREVELWDTSKGTCQNIIDVPPWLFASKHAVSWGWDGAITFSPDGGTLALGCCGICLWDVATAREVRHPTLSGTHCTAIAFSPNGEELASSLGGSDIQLQNLATGGTRRIFNRRAVQVDAITFFPEGETLAVVYHSGLILLWDTATGMCLQQFLNTDDTNPAMRIPYTSIKYLPDGPFLCLDHRYIINLSQENEEPPEHDALLIDKEWITKSGKPLLWLPREYRSNYVAIQGNIVAIEHKSGITFIQFNS